MYFSKSDSGNCRINSNSSKQAFNEYIFQSIFRRPRRSTTCLYCHSLVFDPYLIASSCHSLFGTREFYQLLFSFDCFVIFEDFLSHTQPITSPSLFPLYGFLECFLSRKDIIVELESINPTKNKRVVELKVCCQ